MFKSDQTINVLIGKNIARTTNVQISNKTASTYIANGEIVVLNELDGVLNPGDTYSDSKYIRIVQGRGVNEPLNFSLRIDGAGVLKYSGASYTASQEQISYIGYNGTSGSIDAINGNDYKLSIVYKHNKDMWSEQLNKRVYRYTSDSTATQAEVATEFTKLIIDDSFNLVTPERVVAGTVSTPTGGNYVFTQGSKTITMPSGALTAGTVLRVGTTTTSPVYIVTATPTATTAVLDVPYQGPSATITHLNLQIVSAPTSWGIKLTSKPLDFEVGMFKYLKVIFEPILSNFGSTSLTTTQNSNKGIGEWQSVAELEWFAYGFDGITNRIGHPIPAGRSDVIQGANYDVITIEWVNKHKQYAVSGDKPARNLLYLFIVDGASQTTNVLAQLNPWMASVPGSFATVTV
jgi:hypothetical protein